MSVVSVEETTKRDSSVTGTSLEYTRTFRVRVDNRSDESWTIYLATVGSIPRYLEAHPENIFARLKGLKFSPTTDHWQWWTVVASYDSDPITTDQREKEKPNPMDRRAKIEWNRNRYTEPFLIDKRKFAVQNTAGDYFDPAPERLTGYWVASITKNVSEIPTYVLYWDNVVNEAGFTIQGREVLPRCALLVPNHISDKLEENGYEYYVLKYDLEFRRPPPIPDGQVLHPKDRTPVTDIGGHDILVLDQGLRERSGSSPNYNDRSKIQDDDGSDVNQPVPLDGDGFKLGDPKPDTVFYLAYHGYPTADFTQLPMT